MELFLPLPGLWSKNYFLQKFSPFHQGVPNWFSKQETELSKQEIELFIPLPALWSKTSFTRCFTFFQRSFKLIIYLIYLIYLTYLIILKSILSLRSLWRFLLVLAIARIWWSWVSPFVMDSLIAFRFSYPSFSWISTSLYIISETKLCTPCCY